jgi:RNA-directed DNA polymerase
MNREEEKPASVPARDKQAGEDLWQRHGAERGVWSESMLIALERGVKGNKWFSLIDKIRSEKTLGIAWEKVRRNAGACGVDRISVEFFGKDSENRLLAVKEQLTKDAYIPSAIRRVRIPKPGSAETRPLGIPTVKDRVVQSAVKMVIEPIFESRFAPSSYGFRPGRGCHDALREVERQLKAGRHHIVDVDIKGYFDNIPHQALMTLVKERISDGKVLGLIEAFLKQGVMEEGVETAPEKGSPQGGVISPLLANIYLDPLDWLLSELGIRSVRYADDIVILTENAGQANQALSRLEDWMKEAGLTLHPEKTRIVDMGEARAHFDFLGYRFLRTKKGKLVRLVRPKSKQKLRSTLKPLTKRANGKSMEAIIASINPVLEGWFAYFRQACPREHQEMDTWMRVRLRSILRKRNKGEGKGRGKDHFKWPNRYFEKLGLFSLEHAREEQMSLRRGANC